jgi:Domain of unknown function (DUF3482)
LYLRQQQLLEKLMHRAHATLQVVEVEASDKGKLPDNWSEMITTLRQNPAWQESSVSRNNKQYQEIEAKLVDILLGGDN